MKNKKRIKSNNIVFSCWSRKNYAIFASLKRVVKIAFLSVDVCAKALKKNLLLFVWDIVTVLGAIEDCIENLINDLEVLKINLVSESFKSEYSTLYKNIIYGKPRF